MAYLCYSEHMLLKSHFVRSDLLKREFVGRALPCSVKTSYCSFTCEQQTAVGNGVVKA